MNIDLIRIVAGYCVRKTHTKYINALIAAGINVTDIYDTRDLGYLVKLPTSERAIIGIIKRCEVYDYNIDTIFTYTNRYEYQDIFDSISQRVKLTTGHMITRLLYNCVRYGRLDMIEYLVKLGIDITSAGDCEYNNVLYAACRFDQLEIVRYVLDCGVLHDMALLIAVQYGNLSIVEYLVKRGANVNIEFDNHNITFWSISRGHVEITKYLVANGATLNINDYVLWHAIESGDLDTVKLLVEHGADLSSISRSAIVTTTAKRYFDIYEYLLEKGAVPQLNDIDILWRTVCNQ